MVLQQSTINKVDDATSTLDWLIDQWADEIQYNFILSNITPNTELLDAKPGYFPDTVRSLATITETDFKIPKGVTLAQWALESKWGLNALGAKNYFGHTYNAVKDYMLDPQWVELRERTISQGQITTGKIVRFAKYKNIKECFATHGLYVSQSELYRTAFDQASPENFAKELGKRYATDPEYSIKLITIMKRYHLRQRL